MEILVNHLTRMSPGSICVAGLSQPTRDHVRPVLPYGNLGVDLLVERGGLFGLGMMVDIGHCTPRRDRPEFEDYVFDPGASNLIGVETPDQFWAALSEAARPSLWDIFGVALERDGHTASTSRGDGDASLGVLRPASRASLARPYGKLRLRLSDPDLGPLSIPVTDLRLCDPDSGEIDDRAVQLFEDRLRRRNALLSVGLSHPWSPSGEEKRHWLQVNNIHLDDNPLWPH